MTGYHWEAKSGKVRWLRLNVIRDERLSSTNNIRISLTWRALSPTNNIREAIDVMNVSSTNSNSYNSRISKFLNRFEHHWRDEWLSDQEPNINEQHSEKPLTWWVSHREQQLARISPAWRTQSQWPSKRECHWDAIDSTFEYHWRGEHYHQRTTFERPLTWWMSHQRTATLWGSIKSNHMSWERWES